MDIASVLKSINTFVWGPVMLSFLVGTGIYLMIRLKFRPITQLYHALCLVFKKDSLEENQHPGDISPFQSLMASAGTAIGSGNIVGVTTAMVLGGAGALFWMWVSAIFGLATKYAESVLAMEYRETNIHGEKSGGPMYVLKNGFKNKRMGYFLAVLFSIFTVLASFGIGNMAQSNSLASALKDTLNVPTHITGILLLITSGAVILGGIKSLGRVSEKLVPVMGVFYIIASLSVVVFHIDNLPEGLSLIIQSAFSLEPIAGGVTGYAFAQALRYGIARGVFSNESGLGSGSIMSASAKSDHPCRQGYINMTSTFFDTLIICTMTGLVIACSGVLGTKDATGELVNGSALIIMAFESTFGKAGGYIVTITLVMFIFSTLIGWSYYGEKGVEFLAKSPKYKTIYRLIFIAMVFVGSVTSLNVAWDFSDIANALMAVPNLISLIVLTNVVVKLTDDYEK